MKTHGAEKAFCRCCSTKVITTQSYPTGRSHRNDTLTRINRRLKKVARRADKEACHAE
jgi:hypothetical protein